MHTTEQAPAAPAAPAAPTAPSAPTAPGAPAAPGTPAAVVAPRNITITGADGKTTTISLGGDGPAIAGTEIAPLPPTEDYFAQGAAVGITMTLVTLGIFALYTRWKGRGMKKESTQLNAASTDRFDRLERGMEAIAIEVERISEGQRFVTKMMSERVPAISDKLNS